MLTLFPASATGTQAALVATILKERRIELLGEGFRSNDLLRNLFTLPAKSSSALTDREVYSLTAFLLHENGLIKSEEVINAKTLPKVVMPARDFFVPDDRQDGPEVR